MKKICTSEYRRYIPYIDKTSCGAVYPLSIAGSNQPGDIYADGDRILFWHYCGFAFIYGEYGVSFLDEVYETFLSEGSAAPRRFILFASGRIEKYFKEKDNIITERRLFFEYRKGVPSEAPGLPEGMTLREMDKTAIDMLDGRITPRFSWDDMEEFLLRGKGYCVLDGKTPAAWAFSAAISGEEIDIGVETAPEYRRRGLASAAVNEMIRYIIRQGKKPLWTCRSANTASHMLAESAGFTGTDECYMVSKAVKL